MNTCKSSYWHRERLPFVWKTRKFQGELNWNGSYRWKLSGKKVIPFEILPFPRFYRNDRNFLCHLFESAPRSKSRESKKFTGICKWYNSISILFLVPKKIPVPFVGNFSPKVSAQGNGSKHVSLLWKTGRHQKNIKKGAFLIVVDVICVSNLLYTLFLFPFNYAFFYSSSSCYGKVHVVLCIKMIARWKIICIRLIMQASAPRLYNGITCAMLLKQGLKLI